MSKRDLLISKRDLLMSKRDLLMSKRDLLLLAYLSQVICLVMCAFSTVTSALVYC